MKRTIFGELRVGDYFALVGGVSVEQVIYGQQYTSKRVLPTPEVRLYNRKDREVFAFDNYEEAKEWYLQEYD